MALDDTKKDDPLKSSFPDAAENGVSPDDTVMGGGSIAQPSGYSLAPDAEEDIETPRQTAVHTDSRLDADKQKIKDNVRRMLGAEGIREHDGDYLSARGPKVKDKRSGLTDYKITDKQLRAMLVNAMVDKEWNNIYFMRNGRIDRELTERAEAMIPELIKNVPTCAHCKPPNLLRSMSEVRQLHQCEENPEGTPPCMSGMISSFRFHRAADREAKRASKAVAKEDKQITKMCKKFNLNATMPEEDAVRPALDLTSPDRTADGVDLPKADAPEDLSRMDADDLLPPPPTHAPPIGRPH